MGAAHGSAPPFRRRRVVGGERPSYGVVRSSAGGGPWQLSVPNGFDVILRDVASGEGDRWGWLVVVRPRPAGGFAGRATSPLRSVELLHSSFLTEFGLRGLL